MGPYQGNQSSELGLVRQISGQLQPGDIALADRFFCNWVIADSLRGASTSFSGCTRLARPTPSGTSAGADDHIVTWPKSQRPTTG